jgi:hypothetical protein
MTPTNQPLPIEGTLIENESLMGFVLRLSEMNHLNGVQWLSRILEKTRIFHLSSDQIPLVSWIFGTPFEQLQNASITSIKVNRKIHWQVYSHVITRSYLIRHRTPQICPKCIDEFGFIRKVWDLCLATCCQKHLVLLIEKCEKCKKKISWNRYSISLCNCGYDFRKSSTTLIPLEESIISEWLEEKLSHHRFLVPNITKNVPISQLELLSLDGALRIILAIGLLKDHTDYLSAGKSKIKRSPLSMHNVVTRSITRLSKIQENPDISLFSSEFLITSLLKIEEDGLTENDRNLARQLTNLSRKCLPTRASLLNQNPRSQLQLFYK